MGLFLVYIFKSSVCLAAFYLFYRLLLSRETFHRFNRFALLGILVFSCLLPLLEVSVKQPAEVHQTMMSLEQWLMLANAMNVAESGAQAQVNVTWIQVALLLYLAGILFFALRNVYSLMRLGLLLKSGRKESIGDYVPHGEGVRLIVHSREIAPFSWMKYVVISRKDLDENGREILIHELAHIHNRHSLDLLIADVCIFFQWFNPASWLLKQELQNIHEYEADETVINEGVDAKQYQLLLIKKAVGTRLYSMANSFNHSKLKKRITMMLKEKSSPWARLKYLYVLPVAAIAVTAFARPEVSNTMEEISAVKVNDLAAIVETKTVESTEDVLTMPVVNAMPKDTAKVKKSASRSAKGIKVVGHRAGTPDDKVPIVRIGSDAGDVKNTPLCIINGKEADWSVMQALNPDRIESIAVLKDETSLKEYGDKGKNGVMLILLKSDDEIKVVGAKSITKQSGYSYASSTATTKEGKLKATVYIDGVKVELNDKGLESVVPADQIESINVKKTSDENGDIYVVTKKGSSAVTTIKTTGTTTTTTTTN